ncbi:N6-adenosine-methyltransferase subunit mettl14 [Podochytrium sp. JEL0797]|nr:N6-adenosine-methyltransferase subunit mettl14 [Podochytrium sp. JEL0797]
MSKPTQQQEELSLVLQLREKQLRRQLERQSRNETSDPVASEAEPPTEPTDQQPYQRRIPLETTSNLPWIDWESQTNQTPPTNPTPPAAATHILKNDHLENFILTSHRPQNYVRDSDPATRFLEYPKLETLFTLKRNHVRQYATPARWLKVDLWGFDLRLLGSQFDVILIDPPVAEYAWRSTEAYEREFKTVPAGFSTDMKTLWSWDDVAGMNIQDVAASRSFIFIWIGDGEGLERGRDLLARWGYRRAEDIVWAKTNKTWSGSYQLGPFPCLHRQKEHCLVGIRGTLRRSTDTHFIHCNIDTDVIISEEPPHGDTAKPVELYTIIENFCLGKRRLELFGRDGNVRDGWVTVGAGLSGSNFDREEYGRWFRNAAVVPFSQEIETLRPKSPPPRGNKRF